MRGKRRPTNNEEATKCHFWQKKEITLSLNNLTEVALISDWSNLFQRETEEIVEK